MQIDPVYENVTGLNQHGLYPLVWIYSVSTGLLMDLLTCRARNISFFSKTNRGFAVCCGLIALGGLIPYSPSSPSLMQDLHVWSCVMGTAGYLYLWLKPWLLFRMPPSRLCVQIIAMYILALILFAANRHISGLCELIPTNGLLWILTLHPLLFQSRS